MKFLQRFPNMITSATSQKFRGMVCSPTYHNSRKASFSDIEFDQQFDEDESSRRDKKLRSVLVRLASECAGESMLSLDSLFNERRVPVISTGSLKLDLALGIGGLPKGRVIEIFGREASGKTTLALHILKEATNHGGYCAYFDAENALDTSYAASLGVNTGNLLISPPNSAENILSSVNALARSGTLDAIVVDSVAALVPQCELDSSIGDSDSDSQPQIMTAALRRISASLFHSPTLVIFTNQIRTFGKLGCNEETTCGGNALEFYSAVRLKMIRSGLVKAGNNIRGLKASVEVVKNKLAPGMKKADVEIEFGKGICCVSEVFQLALEHGLIERKGDNYVIGRLFFSNEIAAKQYLAQNKDALCKLVVSLRSLMFE